MTQSELTPATLVAYDLIVLHEWKDKGQSASDSIPKDSLIKLLNQHGVSVQGEPRQHRFSEAFSNLSHQLDYDPTATFYTLLLATDLPIFTLRDALSQDKVDQRP